MLYILILMVLNFRNSGTLEGKIVGVGQPDQLHRLARLAGRVIENPFVSVTTDVLMKCSPSSRANGSDEEKMER